MTSEMKKALDVQSLLYRSFLDFKLDGERSYFGSDFKNKYWNFTILDKPDTYESFNLSDSVKSFYLERNQNELSLYSLTTSKPDVFYYKFVKTKKLELLNFDSEDFSVEVSSRPDLEGFFEIIEKGAGMRESEFEEFKSRLLFLSEKLESRFYVLKYRDNLVSTLSRTNVNKSDGMVFNACTLEDYRGLGFFSILLRTLVSEMSVSEKVYTMSLNPYAIRGFESEGFVGIGGVRIESFKI